MTILFVILLFKLHFNFVVFSVILSLEKLDILFAQIMNTVQYASDIYLCIIHLTKHGMIVEIFSAVRIFEISNQIE